MKKKYGSPEGISMKGYICLEWMGRVTITLKSISEAYLYNYLYIIKRG